MADQCDNRAMAYIIPPELARSGVGVCEILLLEPTRQTIDYLDNKLKMELRVNDCLQ